MKTIVARFRSKCADTGATINKGDACYYDARNRVVYCMDSSKAAEQIEADCTRNYIEAQENAYLSNQWRY